MTTLTTHGSILPKQTSEIATNRFGTMMFDGGPACPCRSACCCKE
nr:MAG TPA: hypothetical protein [Caudoviricetes sp.]